MKRNPRVIIISDDNNFLNSESFLLGSLGVDVERVHVDYNLDSISNLNLKREYDFAVMYFPRYDSIIDYLILRVKHTFKSKIEIIISYDCCNIERMTGFAKKNAQICTISEIVENIFRIFSMNTIKIKESMNKKNKNSNSPANGDFCSKNIDTKKREEDAGEIY